MTPKHIACLALAAPLLLAGATAARAQESGSCEVVKQTGPVSLLILASGNKVQELAATVRDSAVLRRDATTVVFGDGRKYVGSYVLGQKSGHGVFLWPDGQRYKGAFLVGKFHGQGTLVWPNGARYEGNFRDQKRDGRGTLTQPDGTTQSGAWKDDKFMGE